MKIETLDPQDLDLYFVAFIFKVDTISIPTKDEV
jgi:hypothetical protein